MKCNRSRDLYWDKYGIKSSDDDNEIMNMLADCPEYKLKDIINRFLCKNRDAIILMSAEIETGNSEYTVIMFYDVKFYIFIGSNKQKLLSFFENSNFLKSIGAEKIMQSILEMIINYKIN